MVLLSELYEIMLMNPLEKNTMQMWNFVNLLYVVYFYVKIMLSFVENFTSLFLLSIELLMPVI